MLSLFGDFCAVPADSLLPPSEGTLMSMTGGIGFVPDPFTGFSARGAAGGCGPFPAAAGGKGIVAGSPAGDGTRGVTGAARFPWLDI